MSVAIILTQSFEEIEALAVADILRRGGVAVSLIALDERAAGGADYGGDCGVGVGVGVDCGGNGANSNLTNPANKNRADNAVAEGTNSNLTDGANEKISTKNANAANSANRANAAAGTSDKITAQHPAQTAPNSNLPANADKNCANISVSGENSNLNYAGKNGANSNLSSGVGVKNPAQTATTKIHANPAQTASPTANPAQTHATAPTPIREIIGAHGIRVVCDLAFDEAHFADFAAIVLPGGMPAAQTLAQSPRVGAVLREFFGAGKLVCAICAAAWALGAAGVLRGEFSCYDGFDAPAITAHEAFFAAAAGAQNHAANGANAAPNSNLANGGAEKLHCANYAKNYVAQNNANVPQFSAKPNANNAAQPFAKPNTNGAAQPFAKPLGDLSPRYCSRGVSVSGRQITAKSPAFALDFAFAILRALRGEAVAAKVRAGMLFAD